MLVIGGVYRGQFLNQNFVANALIPKFFQNSNFLQNKFWIFEKGYYYRDFCIRNIKTTLIFHISAKFLGSAERPDCPEPASHN